jgi:alpha-methylacyl-CoA racemase
MTDAVLAHNIFPLVTTQVFGKPAPRGADLLTGGVPCYGVYRTADDRYLAVGALEPKFWQAMCAALESPGPRRLYGLATGSKGREVKAELAALLASQSMAHWEPIFAAADCCVTPILRVDEVLAASAGQWRARWWSNSGASSSTRRPFKLSAWPWEVRRCRHLQQVRGQRCSTRPQPGILRCRDWSIDAEGVSGNLTGQCPPTLRWFSPFFPTLP